MKKICVVTGTRAEYGLLSNLMKRINDCPELQLQVVATNMHLSPEFGLTYKEIEADGFHIDKKVEMLLSADTPTATTKSLGLGIIGFADAYNDLKPDMIVILGDRYEMLGATSAALLANIPIAHISGGDVTEGAYDDAIRHSITKMSHLHFTSTEVYRNRVIQLGEEPSHVYNVGSTGIDNIKQLQLMDKKSLEENLGFEFGDNCILVTYHPETINGQGAAIQFQQLLNALERINCRIIFTKPNSDSDGHVIIDMIDKYVASHPEKAVCYTSLGYMRYLSSLQYVQAVVGNSSSGLIEVPSFGIPTVNIGDRQKGRLHAESVINCKTEEVEIYNALKTALSSEFKIKAHNVANPYEKEGTNDKILDVILNCNPKSLLKKHFYDLP